MKRSEMEKHECDNKETFCDQKKQSQVSSVSSVENYNESLSDFNNMTSFQDA